MNIKRLINKSVISLWVFFSIMATSTNPAVGASSTVAFDMVNSNNQGLIGFSNPFNGAFGSAGDGFQKYRRGVSPAIPFSVLDDSLSIFADDPLGIIKEGNTDTFFGVTDTENPDNSGPVSAEWIFDISGRTDLSLSIDMGAMGDFESSDTLDWTYQIDDGPIRTAFQGTVHEAASLTYTLEGGTSVTLNDPMLVDGVVLSNDLQTLTTALSGTGSQLGLTLTVTTDGGEEALAFQNIVITSDPNRLDGFGSCGDPATFIHTIQGSDAASPEVGHIHIIEGVVVGDFQDPATGLGGFFVQEEDDDIDGDPTTSEGIFVFDNGFGVDVDEGDVVRVQGTAVEFFELTGLNHVSHIAACADRVGGATAALVSLPLPSVGNWEFVEGMSVMINQVLTASGNFTQGRYGEVDLSLNGRLENPTNVAAPGAPALAVADLNNRSRIQLDDGSTVQNPLPLPPYLGVDNTLRAGDTIPNLTGVVSYFENYEIHPTTAVNFSRVNERDLAPPEVNGTVTIAAFNVLNYFTTIDTGAAICGPNADQGCRGADTPAEFSRQRAKIVSALTTLDADIVGLIELENNTTDAPTADLVSGLNDVVGAGTYDYLPTGAIGSDAIRVAFIYKPASVRPSGGFETLDSADDPQFHDDKNRPALAQTFEEKATGERFTVVVNHLKSKGSACDDVGDPNAGDGQGNCNGVRTAAAEALLNWLAGDPTGSNDPDYLITGDLNAYAQEDPVTTLEVGGYTDLIEAFQGEGEYSFVFFGEAGYLDHGLSTPSLTPKVTGAALWHINADEPSALDYNNFNQPALYNPDPYRSSDHDPVIVGLQANPKGNKLQARADLARLSPSGDKAVDILVERAINRIDKSLEIAYWRTNAALDPQQGKRVFEEDRQAVRALAQIIKAGGLFAGEARTAINQLIEANRILATIVLDDAFANGRDSRRIAQAQAEMARAVEAVADERFDQAIEYYGKAWNNAITVHQRTFHRH